MTIEELLALHVPDPLSAKGLESVDKLSAAGLKRAASVMERRGYESEGRMLRTLANRLRRHGKSRVRHLPVDSVLRAIQAGQS